MTYCRNCGNQLEDGLAFCPKCGAKVPEQKKKKGGAGKVISFLAGMVLTAAIAAGMVAMGWMHIGKETPAAQGPGYDTSEEAAMAYAQYLKEGDMDGLLSTCATTSFATHENAQLHYETYKSYSTNFSPLPGGTSFRDHIIAGQQMNGFVDALRTAYIGLSVRDTEFEDEWAQKRMFTIEDDAARLTQVLSNGPDFTAMQIEGAIPLEQYVEIRAAFLKSRLKYQATIGAEDMQAQLIRFTLNGQSYILSLETARYDGRWYNVQPRIHGVNNLHIAPVEAWEQLT